MSNETNAPQAEELDADLLNAMTEEERQLYEALVDGFLAQQEGDFSSFSTGELAAMFGL